MRKVLSLLLSAVLFLSSCGTGNDTKNANTVANTVLENEDLFYRCVEEMAAFGEERLYVAMEVKEAEDWEELSEEEKKPRLVSYPKESDDRTEIENALLERALTEFGFRLIFFQTGADSRRCVIFSYTKESDTGVQNGFYYSFDALPCGWWGRQAELIQRDSRYLQIDKSGNAAYFTTAITENFYYFEKYGNLVA